MTLRFGTRESLFSLVFGFCASAFVLSFGQADPAVLALGCVLLALNLVVAAIFAFRPPSRYQKLQREIFRFVLVPVSLTVSLLVSARLLPDHLYFIAVFWTFAAWAFNIAVFRSRFLNAFLGVYVAVALWLAIRLGQNPPFLIGSMVFLTAMTAFILTFHHRVVSELEAEVGSKARQVEEARDFDPRTGLHNRAWFLARLETAVQEARPTTVVALDVGPSAPLHERLGDAGVGALMREIGARLADAGRERDLFAFSGGDRFLLLGRGHTTREQAARFAERMVKAATGEHEVDGRPVRVTATAGVACFPEDGQDAHLILHRAEEAVRPAQPDDTGRIRTFDRETSEARRREVELEGDLRRALPAREFVLHYQPKCDRHGHTHSHESLVRWDRPARGLVPPLEFIPVLERMEIMRDVGYWILDEAIRQTGEWHKHGRPDLSVAVNLSPRQLLDPALPERLSGILATHSLPGRKLECEITENVLVHDLDRTRRVLGALSALGVRISVDDFGTGYSSLVRLLELPVDVIKIDKSFVDGLGVSAQAAAVVRLVLQMARHLGKDTVAEGVETRDQLSFLVDEGCELFQGYYFSRPLTAAAFEARLGAEVH